MRHDTPSLPTSLRERVHAPETWAFAGEGGIETLFYLPEEADWVELRWSAFASADRRELYGEFWHAGRRLPVTEVHHTIDVTNLGTTHGGFTLEDQPGACCTKLVDWARQGALKVATEDAGLWTLAHDERVSGAVYNTVVYLAESLTVKVDLEQGRVMLETSSYADTST